MNEELKEYFKYLFSSIDEKIVLDEDQIKAIINDDKYTLILAGAGTGKTTTMVGKVKYLVDIQKVDPSKILVISYTKKAVEELQTLIIDEFGINTNVTTFHSLAYKYIRKLFSNRKCEVIDYNQKEKIFYDYINKLFKEKRMIDVVNTFNKDKLKDISFFYGKYFEENYYKYEDYDTFFKKYKEYKLEEAQNIGLDEVINNWIEKRLKSEYIVTIKGELVKSVGEATIANYLYKHGIDYSYEEIYTEIVEDRKIYKPDFTLNLAGEKVYLEYFGLNDKKYNKIKQKKIEFHKKYQNKFIYIEYMEPKDIEIKLDLELNKMGFIYRDRTNEEIYNQILDNNKLSQIYKLKNLFYESVDKIKESANRKEYLEIVKNYINSLKGEEKEAAIREFQYINEFYIYYSQSLIKPDTYSFDYADLIYYSNKYISEKPFLQDINYEYIIIDEYQDISDGEYLLARKTADKGRAKVFAVGDDWQSIYSFRGSNIKYITKFDEYFENPTILTIKNTYRNSQELVDISGSFIKENKDQIDKDLISFKHLNHPIHFVQFNDKVVNEYGDVVEDETVEYQKLKKLIIKIHELVPSHSILILGRTNQIIDNCFKYDSDFIDDLGTKIRISSVDDLDMEGMTIHKAKGLTFDEVIIIGMDKNFPRENFGYYWLIDLFRYKPPIEDIPYPEERRLLYVALTRTKNNVFILKNENPKERSIFVDELLNKCIELEKKE